MRERRRLTRGVWRATLVLADGQTVTVPAQVRNA
jgi:hypothetical protein